MNLLTGFASVNGAQIYYEMMGEGHPLVFLHGAPLDLRMWDDQFAEFAKHYQVVRFDLRGFGKSPITKEPFFNYEDINAMLKFLHIEKTSVVGLSFGGYFAIEFTLAHPEKVDRIVVCSSALIGHPHSEEREADRERFNEILSQGNEQKAIEVFINQWLDGPGQSPNRVAADIRARFREIVEHGFSLPSADHVRKLLEPSPISRLEDIQAPMLVIAGELDYKDSMLIADLLQEKIPTVRKVMVPGVAHLLNMEVPEEFNRVVLDFLQE